MFLKSGLATALLTALYVLAFSPAHASSYAASCKRQFDPRDTISAITAAITSIKDLNSKILSRVETVPIGMAAYIKVEIRNSIQQKRADHYLDLVGNQFYWPVQIDDEIKNIADWSELALSVSGKGTAADKPSADSMAADKLSAESMLQAISSYSDLMNDIHVYGLDDARRPKPYLSNADGPAMFEFARSGQEILVRLLDCMLLH